MSGSIGTPGLFCALFGDPTVAGPTAIKASSFLQTLGSQFTLLKVFDTSLSGSDRLVGMLRTIHPVKAIWRQRFYKSTWAFDRRSRRVQEAIRQRVTDISAILQIGVMFDATGPEHFPPTVVYTDYTAALSAENPDGGRSPYRGAALRNWLERERRVYSRAAQICVRSELVRRSILAQYGIPPGKVFVVGGGANVVPEHSVSSDRSPDGPTILFIGKDFYRKGGDIVLAAFDQVRATLPSARLIMVTDPDARPATDLPGVEMVPPTWSKRDIAALYARADLFVLPSRMETWGDVLVEAMAFGLPCVVSSGDAMLEIVEHGITGYATDRGDAASVANAILAILTNVQLRDQMSQVAKQRYSEAYSWGAVVERIGARIEHATAISRRDRTRNAID